MAFSVKKGTFIFPTAVNASFAITGVGFQPKAVILWTASQSAEGSGSPATASFGFATSSTQRAVASGTSDDAVGVSNTGKTTRSTAVIALLNTGTPTVNGLADFVSFGVDGFTLNVSQGASIANQVVHYLALGGADLTNAIVGTHAITRITAGTEATTGLGFMPDAVLFLSGTFGSNPTGVDDQLSIGYALRSPARQGSFYWFDNDGTDPIDMARYQDSAHCLALAAATAATEATATMSSFDASGFTLNWDDPIAATPREFYYLALKGGVYEGGVATQPATNTTQALTTGFSPKGSVFFGTDATANGLTTANGARAFHFGASDRGTQGTPAQGTVANVNEDNSATGTFTTAKRRHLTTQAITMIKTSAGAIALGGDASVTAVGASDLTLTWTLTDAIQRQFFWFAFGDTPIPPPDIPVVTARVRT